MSEPVLSLRGLSVTLHRDCHAVRALDSVDLDLAPGEILALVGESGSGKSTLGLAVQGLLPAEARPRLEGAIRLLGTDLGTLRPHAARSLRARHVRTVFQDALGALNPTMTVGAQMAEACADRAEARDWLARVDLPDTDRMMGAWPHQLSGGQRQRVGIAMAMAPGPALLIADEPTTALDVTVQAQILVLIRDLARARGTAVIFVTHDLAVAAELSERVAVLYAGRLAEVGPTKAVIHTPAHAYTAALLGTRFDFAADRTRPLPTISGEPPGGSTAPGCAFAPRCTLAEPGCAAPAPLNAVAQHSGRSACRRADVVRTVTADTFAPWPVAPSAAGEPALRFEAVVKSFRLPATRFLAAARLVPAVRGVSLEVPKGGALAIVGESGSGKSTLLRLAAGLTRPDGGRVLRAAGAPPQMIHQDAAASFTPWLTVGEQIGERLRPLGLSRSERAERVATALAEAGLPGAESALPSELSGGQCQRAAIARAIVVPPKLLLCDEPVSAMDVSLAAQTLNLLGSLRRRLGMALVFVTHDLAAARIVADHIAVMRAGEIVEEGPVDALTTAPSTPYARSLLAAMPQLDRARASP